MFSNYGPCKKARKATAPYKYVMSSTPMNNGPPQLCPTVNIQNQTVPLHLTRVESMLRGQDRAGQPYTYMQDDHCYQEISPIDRMLEVPRTLAPVYLPAISGAAPPCTCGRRNVVEPLAGRLGMNL